MHQFILFSLSYAILLGAPSPVEAGEDTAFATREVLRQRGPRLGRHGFQKILKTVFPGLTADPGCGCSADGEHWVIDRVIARRGPVLIRDQGGVEHTGQAVTLLAVHTSREGKDSDFLTSEPELAVVTLGSKGRLLVPFRKRFDNLGQTWEDFSEQKGQPLPQYNQLEGQTSPWKQETVQKVLFELELWELHPKASGLHLTITVRTVTSSRNDQERKISHEIEDSIEHRVLAAEGNGFGILHQEALMLMETRHTMGEGDKRWLSVSQESWSLEVDPVPVQGLNRLQATQRRKVLADDRLLQSEIEVMFYCYDGTDYMECQPWES